MEHSRPVYNIKHTIGGEVHDIIVMCSDPHVAALEWLKEIGDDVEILEITELHEEVWDLTRREPGWD